MSGEELDVLLFPTVYSYVPVFSRAKKIVIIHDIIAEKYPQLTLPTAASRFFWRAKAALARWQADAIATVSDYSREGILRHFGLAPDRVFVVSEASDPIFRVLERAEPTERLCSHGITAGQRLITYLGGFSPHKNLETLVAVFADLASRKEFSDVRLVMAGETEREVFHNYFQEIKAQVEKLDVSDRVIFTGYLRDEEIVTLLNLSTVLVLPSLIEGFGLPAIEAAACGCPVIATSASPLPGLLGEAAIFIDPLKSKELATALDRVLTSAELRCRMREGGTAAARRLTWEAAAQQMSDLIKHVVAQ
jgi:glycosyltransferase involved in cell wall biosynthesis